MQRLGFASSSVGFRAHRSGFGAWAQIFIAMFHTVVRNLEANQVACTFRVCLNSARCYINSYLAHNSRYSRCHERLP